MNIRWLWGNYIEPEWKLPREEVRRVHRLVKERYMRPWVLFGFTGLWLLIMYGVVAMMVLLDVKSLPTFWYVLLMVGALTTLIALALWSFRMIYIRPVRRAMRDLGYDVCIPCGYWLKGLADDVRKCPECGADRE